MTEPLSPAAQAVFSAWAKPVDVDRSLVVSGQALEAQARGALAAAGMTEKLIMRGACQLAFNKCRSIEDMAKLSKDYDLNFADELEGANG